MHTVGACAALFRRILAKIGQDGVPQACLRQSVSFHGFQAAPVLGNPFFTLRFTDIPEILVLEQELEHTLIRRFVK